MDELKNTNWTLASIGSENVLKVFKTHVIFWDHSNWRPENRTFFNYRNKQCI
jgi:hypothetical protein